MMTFAGKSNDKREYATHAMIKWIKKATLWLVKGDRLRLGISGRGASVKVIL